MRKKRLFAFVRVGLGLAILAWVARSLPWSDELSLTSADGQKATVRGEILGDWKRHEIEFRVPPGTILPALLEAAPWRSEADGGRVLRVQRHAGREGPAGYEWRPGMPTAFGQMDRGGLARAMGLFSLGMLLVITRWWRLLYLASCPTSWFNAFRLTFLGMFFNLVVPGLTGGDVVKAVVVAGENPGRRADALVSVVVDRILGLGVLAVIAVVVVLASGAVFEELWLPLVGGIALGVLGIFLYALKPLRRRLGLSALVDRLPFGEKLRSLDRAALVYLRHPLEMALAVAISAANHFLIIWGVCELARAFGVTRAMVSFAQFMVLVPVANIVSALPVAPGGWGVGEATYEVLFDMVGADGALGVATSVSFRLCSLCFGLVGGLFLLLPSYKAEIRALQEEGTAAL